MDGSELTRVSRAPGAALLALLICSCSSVGHARRDEAVRAWRAADRAPRIADARAAGAAQEPAQDAALASFGLDELLAHAEQHAPAVRAAYQRWRAALEDIPRQTALPDPRLTLGAYLAEIETRTGPMQARAGLSQAFPWFGTLAAAGDAAFEAAEVARERLEAQRLAVRFAVAEAWYERNENARLRALAAEHVELLRELESVTRALYETGLSPHQNLLRLQLDRAEDQDLVDQLDAALPALDAALRAALGVGTDTPLPPPVLDPPAAPEHPELAKLQSGLAGQQPELRALEREERAAAERERLAEKRRSPGFLVGVDYTVIGDSPFPGVAGSGDDAIAVTLGVELPLRQAWRDAEVARARAQQLAFRASRVDLLHELEARLALEQFRLLDADRRVSLNRDGLVPKAEEALGSLLAAYETGGAGFDGLIDTERLLLQYRIDQVRAETERAQALAALERTSGALLRPRER